MGKGPGGPGQPLTCCVTSEKSLVFPELQFPITKIYHLSCLFGELWGLRVLKSHPTSPLSAPVGHHSLTRSDSQADFFSEPWLARRCGCGCWGLQGPSRAGGWALGQCGQLPALLGRIPPLVEIWVSGTPGDGGHSSPWRGAGVPRDQRLPGACSSSGVTGKRSRHTGLGGCRVGNSTKDRLSCWHTATGWRAVPGGPTRWG